MLLQGMLDSLRVARGCCFRARGSAAAGAPPLGDRAALLPAGAAVRVRSCGRPAARAPAAATLPRTAAPGAAPEPPCARRCGATRACSARSHAGRRLRPPSQSAPWRGAAAPARPPRGRNSRAALYNVKPAFPGGLRARNYTAERLLRPRAPA
ncbi:MAG: hypothetical protein J3K34DRAFT_194441 [Monoraphidium minutum]|nr:MAG: hypothetical protein J3K34DRAFT_194441 [Monoraphidium minutum]